MNRVSSVGCLAVTGAALAFASLCNAQDTGAATAANAPDAAAAGAPLEEITVSATRIERAGFTSPTPVTSVSATDIAATGATDINDVLQYIPQMRPSQTSTSSDSKQFAAGANYADLRGLNPTRTLVLVDGERFVPEVPIFNSTITYQVDLNVIPTIAIQRVDVVTGGASAAWGSDALAGVVNLIPYRRYDGLLVTASAGISQYGDNRSKDFALLGGQSFADDRAHFVIAASYDQNDGVGDIFTRPWGASAPFLLANPAACATYCYLAGTGFQNSTQAPGGVITNTALKGIAFGPNGSPYTFPTGTFTSGSSGEFGGSIPGNYPQQGVALEPPSTRAALYGRASYNLADNLSVDLTINSSDSHVTAGTKPFLASYTIQSGNPYIPASVQAAMTAQKIANFSLGVANVDLGTRVDQTFNNWVNRGSIGLDWDIGHTWKANAYYAYGESLEYDEIPNNINTTNAAQAANAVLGANGQIVCANPANGCVPLDVFGSGTESPGALSFILKTGWSQVRYIQETGGLNVNGEPIDIWAGPVSLAVGVEARHEEQRDTNDPYQLAGQMLNIDNENFSGDFSVKEAYVETVIPLAKGLPFIKEFDLNAADRDTDYSTVGHADTWKYGATWNVTDDLLLRATHSRDIRAPNLTELYYPNTLQNATTSIPGQTQLASFYSGGNSKLVPEVALGTVAGVTYRPHFVPGLNASLDIFKDDLTNVITSESSPSILTACAAGNATACGQLTKVNGIVTTVTGGFLNISTINYTGLDAEIDYTTSLAKLGLPLPGTLVFRELGTYTGELAYQAQPGTPFTNFAGQTVQGIAVHTMIFAPHFKGEFSAGYNLNHLSVTVMADFISQSVADKTMNTAQYAENDIPSYVKYNLLGSYSFGATNQFQLFGTVNNLLNKAPPFAANPLESISTDPNMYDTIGRTYQLGFRFKL